MVLVLPMVSLALGLILGHWLGRSRRWGIFVALMLAIIALFFWGILTLRARDGTGFDGVAEAALLVLGLVPLEAGALAGAAVAAWRNRRDAHGG